MAFEREIRDAEIIERWGVVRAHRRGSMGAHSHRVAIYADQIATLLDWKGDRTALLRHALWHDMEEVFTGDIPGPTKRRMGPASGDFLLHGLELRFPGREWVVPPPVDETILDIVKLADIMDELLWATVERSMGNSLVSALIEHTGNRLDSHMAHLGVGFGAESIAALWRSIIQAVAFHQLAPRLCDA